MQKVNLIILTMMLTYVSMFFFALLGCEVKQSRKHLEHIQFYTAMLHLRIVFEVCCTRTAAAVTQQERAECCFWKKH